MKPQLTKEAFAEWCEKKPADKFYDYENWRTCACAQYANHLGVEYPIVFPRENGTFWEQAEYAAVNATTFGALAKRLRGQS